jgi:hypothetical protein
MAATTVLARDGISVDDYRCSYGPGDAPFPERHGSYSVAYVRRGSFGYRVNGAPYELVAGSLLVGRPGDEYVCTHDHAHGGDECLAFHLAPETVDAMRRAARSGRRGERRRCRS